MPLFSDAYEMAIILIAFPSILIISYKYGNMKANKGISFISNSTYDIYMANSNGYLGTSFLCMFWDSCGMGRMVHKIFICYWDVSFWKRFVLFCGEKNYKGFV